MTGRADGSCKDLVTRDSGPVPDRGTVMCKSSSMTGRAAAVSFRLWLRVLPGTRGLLAGEADTNLQCERRSRSGTAAQA